MTRKILLIIACGCFSLTLNAQRNHSSQKLADSRASLRRADRFTDDSIRKAVPDLSRYLRWIKGSNLVDFSTTDNSGLKTFYIADAVTGKTRRLFDAKQYTKSVEPYIEKKVNIQDPRFSCTSLIEGSKYKLLCRAEGKDIVLDLENNRFSIPDSALLNKKPGMFSPNKEPWKRYTADSLFSIYGKRHNIYLSRTGSDDVVQLTHDAEAYYSFSTYRTGETDDNLKAWRGQWFRDTHIAYGLRVDYRKVSTLTIVNSIAEPAPKAQEYKFELAGDKYVAQYELILVYADSAKVMQADIQKFQDQEVKLVFGSNQHNAIYFTRKNRVGDTLELCKLDPYTAKVSIVVTETSKPIVNDALHNYALIDGGKEIIWWSERTGKGAYYLYDGAGRLKNAITPQDMVAGKIFSIDTLARTMIFEGYGYHKLENPYYKKYYKVGLNGRGFTELTPSNGEHAIELSPDKQFIIDRYSTVEKMEQCEIRDMRGRLKTVIPMPADSALIAYGWSRPKLETVKAADNRTNLYGIIFTPSDLDPTKKYPVICAVYPGPHTDLIPHEFGLDHDNNGSLAQMGFIVIQFGYRGTSPLRGREFYTFGYGNMRDYALEDCKHVTEQLAEKYPYMDLDRVGIYGHSGGGFMSTAAILTYPDFFKVAVAVSGNHDNNIYGKYWAEPYHGVTPVAAADSAGTGKVEFRIKVPTTIELADRLKGRLFLITGEIDNNVHPANTIRMADALIKNNKRFDMMILPGKDHGMIGSYYYNLIRYYFEDHLKNPTEFDVDIVGHSSE